MQIEVKNLILTFDNIKIIEKRIDNLKQKFICTDDINYLTMNIKYDLFIQLLENSQNTYVDTKEFNLVLEECFNYFKISTNPLIKKNMAEKITFIILTSLKDNNNQSLILFKKILNNYLLNQLSVFNYCQELIFLKILSRIQEISIKKNKNIFCDSDNFTLFDFILDMEN